jgi:hypothetical protein
MLLAAAVILAAPLYLIAFALKDLASELLLIRIAVEASVYGDEEEE